MAHWQERVGKKKSKRNDNRGITQTGVNVDTNTENPTRYEINTGAILDIAVGAAIGTLVGTTIERTVFGGG